MIRAYKKQQKIWSVKILEAIYVENERQEKW